MHPILSAALHNILGRADGTRMRAAATPIPSTQVRAYLATCAPEPPMWERPIVDLRREEREWSQAIGGIPEAVASVETVDACGVRSRLYRPAGGEQDVLVWLHGGAWMLGDPECHDPMLRRLANRAGCAVLAADYRLAPEHRYPAAVEDAWDVTLWSLAQFSEVAIGGDSAGGNLAAAVALRARDRGIRLAAQLLVYPVLDSELRSPFYASFAERYAGFAGSAEFGATSQRQIRYIWETYVPDPDRRRERDASPLRATSLRGAAPAVVIAAEHDILWGDAQAYARRLAAADVPVQLHNYAGQIHGFFTMLGKLDDSGDAVDRSAAALAEAFGH